MGDDARRSETDPVIRGGDTLPGGIFDLDSGVMVPRDATSVLLGATDVDDSALASPERKERQSGLSVGYISVSKDEKARLPLPRPNQDSILVDEENGLFVVADGVGGHYGGAEASRATVDAMAVGALPRSARKETVRGALASGVVEAINRVSAIEDPDNPAKKAASTLLAVHINDEGVLTGINVGDSRMYIIRDGRVLGKTKDQSREDEPNVVTNIIGGIPRDEVFAKSQKLEVQLQPGDRVILASDGITGDFGSDVLSDREVLDAVGHDRDADAAAMALYQTSRKVDDTSVIVIDYEPKEDKKPSRKDRRANRRANKAARTAAHRPAPPTHTATETTPEEAEEPATKEEYLVFIENHKEDLEEIREAFLQASVEFRLSGKKRDGKIYEDFKASYIKLRNDMGAAWANVLKESGVSEEDIRSMALSALIEDTEHNERQIAELLIDAAQANQEAAQDRQEHLEGSKLAKFYGWWLKGAGEKFFSKAGFKNRMKRGAVTFVPAAAVGAALLPVAGLGAAGAFGIAIARSLARGAAYQKIDERAQSWALPLEAGGDQMALAQANVNIKSLLKAIPELADTDASNIDTELLIKNLNMQTALDVQELKNINREARIKFAKTLGVYATVGAIGFGIGSLVNNLIHPNVAGHAANQSNGGNGTPNTTIAQQANGGNGGNGGVVAGGGSSSTSSTSTTIAQSSSTNGSAPGSSVVNGGGGSSTTATTAVSSPSTTVPQGGGGNVPGPSGPNAPVPPYNGPNPSGWTPEQIADVQHKLQIIHDKGGRTEKAFQQFTSQDQPFKDNATKYYNTIEKMKVDTKAAHPEWTQARVDVHANRLGANTLKLAHDQQRAFERFTSDNPTLKANADKYFTTTQQIAGQHPNWSQAQVDQYASSILKVSADQQRAAAQAAFNNLVTHPDQYPVMQEAMQQIQNANPNMTPAQIEQLVNNQLNLANMVEQLRAQGYTEEQIQQMVNNFFTTAA